LVIHHGLIELWSDRVDVIDGVDIIDGVDGIEELEKDLVGQLPMYLFHFYQISIPL